MQSSEQEEPDILNTPKSVTQVSEANKKLSRKLFTQKDTVLAKSKVVVEPNKQGDKAISDKDKANENKTKESESLKRHAARTSQVNEYQNISPTPSTDL